MTEKTQHKSLYAALAAAQAEMGRAAKDSNNPHFKSKYADLASVMDACMPALSRHGIAVLQPAFDEGGERYVKTIFVHGESGESAECRVPLIVQKNDMQGYGSAATYARRYGLMGMAGIAADDDDGNAAAKAAPTKPQTINAQQFINLRDLIEGSAANESRFLAAYGASSLEQFPLNRYAEAVAALNKKIEQARAKDLGGDGIPQFEKSGPDVGDGSHGEA